MLVYATYSANLLVHAGNFATLLLYDRILAVLLLYANDFSFSWNTLAVQLSYSSCMAKIQSCVNPGYIMFCLEQAFRA
uniref:Uncharacterized protein n=1 Tax=Anguilla anguilla TaxID=7936 RepID=A0A0E9RJD5_ANGAN